MIDPVSQEGKIPDCFVGDIAFKDVNFRYPSRTNHEVLVDVNVEFKSGQTTVLVGPSGMGKSSLLRLIQRLYDPCSGQVTLDGEDVRNLNVRWLREAIGIVHQDPVLFATTIYENILLGSDHATYDDVISAAKSANAYDFIMDLPEKFETMVGAGGCQLSGGQKQRVAIARALVRKPKILLLDQACSALDTQSEAVVLEQLKKIQHKRTIIMVAHRLSTISAADVIIGMEHGQIVEKGTQEELMKNNKVFFTLATMQQMSSDGNLSNGDVEDYKKIQEIQESRNKRVPSGDGGVPDVTIQVDEVRTEMSVNDTEKTDTEVTELTTKEESDDDESDDAEPVPTSRILKLNAPEYPYIIWGTLGGVINGLIQPLYGILLSGILGVFVYPTEEEIRAGVNFFCIILTAIGVLSLLTHTLQHYMFAKSGEILTRRIRTMAFTAVLRQNIGWFDDPSNNAGTLSSRLATDAGRVKGAAGFRVGIVVSTLTTIVGALIVAFYFGWQLALVEISFFPFVVVANAAQVRFIHKGAQLNKKEMEETASLVTQTLGCINTVTALGKENYFSDKYDKLLKTDKSHAKKMALIYGITFGVANSITHFSSAAMFRFGAFLVASGEMEFVDMFRVHFVIIFVGISLGRASVFTPDLAKAKKAATRVFRLFDLTPTIDSYSTEGEKWDNFQGRLQLKQCQFTYPARPDSLVLKGLDVKVESGQTLAFVGQSGCGKSTTVQLLERFYDPDVGQVFVDDRDIKTVNVNFLRSKIGIVFQDPVLFDGTVYDNIVYGDSERSLTREEVHKAAKLANIHDIILAMDQGYDSDVGHEGSHFSRGEKQRIAIARALARDPSILLLDEATSALDTENEKIVQEALDRARRGRTTIMIAHRLSTIRKADQIAVMSAGKIVEQGTHEELMQNKQAYYNLVTTNASLS